MQDIKKILELRRSGLSQRKIAPALSKSRNTVKRVFEAADDAGIEWLDIKDLSESQVYSLLFGKENVNLVIEQPDFDYVHKELLKPGTTVKTLWEEYVDQCRSSKKPFYHYSYYSEQYRDYVKKNNLTMHINHKPGDKMMVDWNGVTMSITDPFTGDETTVYLFEATLPFSMFCYVQACTDMKINNWIDCHIKAYQYFGGCTRLLIPDNLKTGVISHKKYEDPVLNKSYQEMADHYDTTIIPTRVKAPKQAKRP